MTRPSTPVRLTAENRAVLEKWAHAPKTEQRMALRSQIILKARNGKGTLAIAAELGIEPATVSKWRIRFAKDGISGLYDSPRSGPGLLAEYRKGDRDCNGLQRGAY